MPDSEFTYLNSSNTVSVPNCTRGLCKWTKLNTGMMLILSLTLLLNVFSSIILFRVPLVTVRGRSNPVYLCIRCLNVCDVLQALLLIIMPAFANSDCDWLGGQWSCNIMGFFVLFFVLVSPLITILMAFDRVIALYQPFKYRSHWGLKMLKILLPLACFSVLILTSLPLMGVGEYHVVKGRRFCLLDTITDDVVSQGYAISVHAIFLLALLFMAACTITFQIKLVRMTFSKKHEKNQSRKKSSSRRTRNATITTMAVCCIFIICYMPYVIRVLYEASTRYKSPLWITWITFGLSFFQPLLNPVVYLGTNSRYRQELKALMKNLSTAETESSSESGGTHIVSRGAWAGFRRRLSSTGVSSKPGSRRGSSKRRTIPNHSQTSTQQNPSCYNTLENGKGRRSQSSTLMRKPECSGGDVSFDNTPYDLNGVLLRNDPSTSSGIKSSDSKDRLSCCSTRNSLSPVMGGSLPRYCGANAKRYGRGERRELSAIYSEDGDVESETRERSNTVSGDKSPGRLVSNASSLTSKNHCISVPVLSDQKTNHTEKNIENSYKQNDDSNEILEALPYFNIPEYTDSKYVSSISNLSDDLKTSYNNCLGSIFGSRNKFSDENTSSNDDSAVISECMSGITETKTAHNISSRDTSPSFNDTNIKTDLPLIVEPCSDDSEINLKTFIRSTARSSYKNALGSNRVMARKPPKRDSGVDADDAL